MRIRDHPQAEAAMLLVGIAAFNALLGVTDRWPQAGPQLTPAHRTLPPPGSSARKSVDWCREHVDIISDVHWASACLAMAQEQQERLRRCRDGRAVAGCELQPEPPDDSPDCTLPEGRARVLNLARARAEQQCVDGTYGSLPFAHADR